MSFRPPRLPPWASSSQPSHPRRGTTTPAPPIAYAKGRDAHIAYQTAGEGPPDLLLVLGAASSSTAWEEPTSNLFLQRLTAFSRLVTFDQRGCGRSDPVSTSQLPTLEERVDDLLTVIDAANLERVALFGTTDGGAISMMFAATYPERVSALVLANTWARLAEDDDFPLGHPAEVLEAGARLHWDSWGSGSTVEYGAPSVANNPDVRAAWARHEQSTASPGQAVALGRMAIELDVRSVLPAISVPTLILHADENLVASVAHGRYLAEHIPGARLVEYPSSDHVMLVGQADVVLDEVEEFLTGVRPGRYRERILATVLFTDIVDSTKWAVQLGDRSWRALLARHHALVRRELERFEGHEVDTAGDGFFAVFHGPGRAIHCARAIRDAVATLNLQLRIGVHTGECEIIDDDISGIAVHIGARVAAKAEPGEILVSSPVRDLVVGSGIEFTHRGSHALKGVPGEWNLFRVERISG